MLKPFFYLTALFCCLFFPPLGKAVVYLEVTKASDSALPIAVVPFFGQSSSVNGTTNIAQVIQQDLYNSGRFKPLDMAGLVQLPHNLVQADREYWKKARVNYLVLGGTKLLPNGLYSVNFSLVDLNEPLKPGANPAIQGLLLSQQYTTSPEGLRKLAHYIADQIYEKLMSERGIFSTKIAYVLTRNNSNYELIVADYDGYHPRSILRSRYPIMSPAWSPDGKTLAYVSFEGGNPAIYLHTLSTGERRLVSNSPGINGAPAFSPDGSKLALVLTLSGMPNVYIKDLMSGKVDPVLNEEAIDTEPVWSRDGKKLFFTSDRGGSPQIYAIDLTSQQVSRVTYDGRYNARASLSAEGQTLVLLHLTDTGIYSIAAQNLSSGRLKILAQPPYTQSPSIAPNGAMVAYSWRDPKGNFLLGMVSSDGKVQIRLPSEEGSIREPAWSPFLTRD